MGHLSTFACSATLENEVTIFHLVFDVCQTISNSTIAVNGHDSAWSGIFMRVLIEVEDILSICSEM
jgi:hypothetical protein